MKLTLDFRYPASNTRDPPHLKQTEDFKWIHQHTSSRPGHPYTHSTYLIFGALYHSDTICIT